MDILPSYSLRLDRELNEKEDKITLILISSLLTLNYHPPNPQSNHRTDLATQSISSATRILFVILKSSVFKSPTSPTYVIFGEARIENLSSQLKSQAAKQFKAPNLGNNSTESEPETSTTAQDDEYIDENGVEAKDIELVMTQAGVSRPKAVKVPKAADGDIVTTLMKLPCDAAYC